MFSVVDIPELDCLANNIIPLILADIEILLHSISMSTRDGLVGLVSRC